MTGDLISRKALVKVLIAERDKHPPEVNSEHQRYNQAIRGGIRKALREIEMAPAVDAAPVVHGRWIDSNGAIRCSECLHTPLYDYHGRLKLSKACPTCGANMWKEREE